MTPRIGITELESAVRQLDEASRMLIDERDIIATHTVASAAENILHDIAGHSI
jgi:translation initiation factor 2B subunit (eIF-2B alpha/beta/delta family)